MSPVEFKKTLCRPVDFKGQWPQWGVGLGRAWSVFLFVFYTGVVQLLSAGLPLTSCFWTTGAPSVQGVFQCPHFFAATPPTRTLTGAMQTTSTAASTTSATPPPQLSNYAILVIAILWYVIVQELQRATASTLVTITSNLC